MTEAKSANRPARQTTSPLVAKTTDPHDPPPDDAKTRETIPTANPSSQEKTRETKAKPKSEPAERFAYAWNISDPPPDGFHLDLQRFAPANALSIASRILYNRDIRNSDDAHSFLSNDIDNLHDPFAIPGIREAVNVIRHAIAQNQRIGIIGDFDADGITATAILILALRRLGAEPSYHLPHRENEGHGMSIDALDRFKRENVEVVITVDTGITDFDEVEHANSIGMKVIITDHHISNPERLPDAVAIINHHLAENELITDYSGSATAFKLAAALLAPQNDPQSVQKLIPLAAIGTLADSTELRLDNRIIVKHGLKLLQSQEAPTGLIELARLAQAEAKHKGPYNANFINFQIAPRINAPGRIGSAEPSIKLIIAQDAHYAIRLAKEIDRINKERRRISELVRKETAPHIEAALARGQKIIAIEVSPQHPMGILGPLAGSVSGQTGLPTFAYQIIDGVARASARSPKQFNLIKALSGFQNSFERLGGHEAAAGFQIQEQHIPNLIQHLHTQVAWSALTSISSDGNPVKEADCELELHQIGTSMWDFVTHLEPFGAGNPEPIFIIRNARHSNLKIVGRNENHLRMNIIDANNRSIEAFGFNIANRAPKNADPIDAAVSLRINYFRGKSRRELYIHDIAQPKARA